jgi:glucose/mannose transport system substrate-binding protein
VAFNLKKGSLPIRGDVDLAAANDCMRKGLEILAAGDTMPDVNMLNTEDTNNQLNDLFIEFFNDASITPEAAQARFVDDRREQGLTVLLPAAGPHHARAGDRLLE